MNGRTEIARGIDDIKVTEEPSGDSFRRIVIEWNDARTNRQRRVFMGDSARLVHADLAACAVSSETARQTYIIGLIRAFTIISEKLPQLAVV